MRVYKSNGCKKFTGVVFLLAVIGSFGFSCQVLADEDLNLNKYSGDQFDNWPRASNSELDQLRGGFLLPNGMNINISIEKITYLNGVETFNSFFQFPENGSLLQNGIGNLAPDVAGPALGSVIQNNLDNQLIKTINEINLEISNLQNLDLNHSSKVFTDLIMPNVH